MAVGNIDIGLEPCDQIFGTRQIAGRTKWIIGLIRMDDIVDAVQDKNLAGTGRQNLLFKPVDSPGDRFFPAPEAAGPADPARFEP